MEKARGIMRFREEAKSGGETRNCRFSERERERGRHILREDVESFRRGSREEGDSREVFAEGVGCN